MTEHADETGFVPNARRRDSMSLGSALFLTMLLILGLSALAFWPSRSWSPPHRPGIAAPIVFDEFVNPTNAAPATSNEAAHAAP